VLAVLACTVVADLAGCDGGVVLIGTLAAIAYVDVDKPTRPTGKGLGTPALELPDPRGCQVCGAGCDTAAVQQVGAVATDLRRVHAVQCSAGASG